MRNGDEILATDMKPSLTFTVHAVAADNTEWVGDGSLIIRADLVKTVRSPQGVRVIETTALEAILRSPAARWSRLDDLVPSRSMRNTRTTPDGALVAEFHALMLAALGRPLQLGTAGPRSPISVWDAEKIVAIVLPVVSDETPLVMRWPARTVRAVIEANGLLGYFDGGTWSRAMLQFIAAPDPRTYIAQLEALHLDEAQVFELLASQYIEPGDRHSRGNRGGEGVFIARDLSPTDAGSVQHEVSALAASYGVADVVLDGACDIVAIYRALGAAFARKGSSARVFLIGHSHPFIVIREHLTATGPFAQSVPYVATPSAPVTDPSPVFDSKAGFRRLFETIQAHGCTRLEVVDTFEAAEHREAPSFAIHVLRRWFGEHPEPSYFLLTDGLSTWPLGATAPGSIQRMELLLWSDRYDHALISTFILIGRSLHALATPGGAPFFTGHTLSASPGMSFMGWPHVLLSAFKLASPMSEAGFDVIRLMPITKPERERIHSRPDPLGGWSFVTELENTQFSATLARWYNPPTGDHDRPIV